MKDTKQKKSNTRIKKKLKIYKEKYKTDLDHVIAAYKAKGLQRCWCSSICLHLKDKKRIIY
jgi:hypothetical protein